MGGSLAPHDVRRTFAKLAHKVRVPLEQIQITLGHASIQTNMTPVTSRGGAGVDVASDYRKLAEADQLGTVSEQRKSRQNSQGPL